MRQRSTTKNWKIGAQNVYIAISGCRSLSQSPMVNFFTLRWVWSKPHICCWNCHPICHSSTDISISGFGATLPFPVVGHYRNHLATLYSGSSCQKSRTCRWNFVAVCCSSRGITVSGFADVFNRPCKTGSIHNDILSCVGKPRGSVTMSQNSCLIPLLTIYMRFSTETAVGWGSFHPPSLCRDKG